MSGYLDRRARREGERLDRELRRLREEARHGTLSDSEARLLDLLAALDKIAPLDPLPIDPERLRDLLGGPS